MSIVIQRGGGPNLTIKNPSDVVYLKGDEFTDDSVRFEVDIQNRTELQLRANTVWNLGELEIGGNSLFLGHDVALSAVASSIQITSIDAGQKSIVVDTPVADAGSSPPRTVELRQKRFASVVQPIFDTENTTMDHRRIAFLPFQSNGSEFRVKTGSVAATEPVTMTFSKGLAPGGVVFRKQVLPASKFPASSDVLISEFGTGVGFFPFDQVLIRWLSDAPFSLLGDTTPTPYFALDTQRAKYTDVLTETLILSNDLRIAFSNDLQLARGNAF